MWILVALKVRAYIEAFMAKSNKVVDLYRAKKGDFGYKEFILGSRC